MQAQVGDEIVVHSRHVGEHGRTGRIIEVKGHEGQPPYLVRWEDGHEAVFFPSADSSVTHHPAANSETLS